MNILVNGAAGFIGFHTARRLLQRGDHVVGIDNLNDYYDVELKKARLALLDEFENFEFIQLDIANRPEMGELFDWQSFDRVIHLAAQAGVRYSIENPHAYIDSNIVGTLNVLEGCRHQQVGHLVYASSSSVYGANTKTPFAVDDGADHPVSLYGATKRSNEMMAHSYSSLYDIPTTGLRFFTVYGPWGRPDMAPFIFTQKILAGEPIDVFNYGKHRRDFTYIDDIVEGVVRVCDRPATGDPNWDSMQPNPSSSSAPYRVYNIGNNSTVGLMEFIRTLESCLDRKAELNMKPKQPGDVLETQADVTSLIEDFDYRPTTQITDGVKQFVNWYVDFYRVESQPFERTASNA